MLTTFKPASAIARFSSPIVPPCSTYSVISSFQGSRASYPSRPAIRIFSRKGVGRIVLVFKQYMKSAMSQSPLFRYSGRTLLGCFVGIHHRDVVGCVQTAVEVQDHTVDPAAGRRGKVDDRGSDLFGRSQVAQTRGEIWAAMRRLNHALAWRIDPAGSHHVAGYAVVEVLDRHLLGQAEQAGFARTVCTQPAQRTRRARRADVNNGARAALEPGQ